MIYVNCCKNHQVFTWFSTTPSRSKTDRPGFSCKPLWTYVEIFDCPETSLRHQIGPPILFWSKPCHIRTIDSNRNVKTQCFYEDLHGQVKKTQCFSLVLTSPRETSGIQVQIHRTLLHGLGTTKKWYYFWADLFCLHFAAEVEQTSEKGLDTHAQKALITT